MHPRAAPLAALLVLLVVASPADAALFLELDPAAGPPGVVVVGRTRGTGSLAGSADPLPAYLARSDEAGTVTDPENPRLVAIGAVVVDDAGNGRLTFEVPAVAPGSYTILVHCEECAPTSAGRTMLPVAEFRVESAVPATDTVAVQASDGSPIAILFTGLAGAIGWIAVRRHSYDRRVPR